MDRFHIFDENDSQLDSYRQSTPSRKDCHRPSMKKQSTTSNHDLSMELNSQVFSSTKPKGLRPSDSNLNVANNLVTQERVSVKPAVKKHQRPGVRFHVETSTQEIENRYSCNTPVRNPSSELQVKAGSTPFAYLNTSDEMLDNVFGSKSPIANYGKATCYDILGYKYDFETYEASPDAFLKIDHDSKTNDEFEPITRSPEESFNVSNLLECIPNNGAIIEAIAPDSSVIIQAVDSDRELNENADEVAIQVSDGSPKTKFRDQISASAEILANTSFPVCLSMETVLPSTSEDLSLLSCPRIESADEITARGSSFGQPGDNYSPHAIKFEQHSPEGIIVAETPNMVVSLNENKSSSVQSSVQLIVLSREKLPSASTEKAHIASSVDGVSLRRPQMSKSNRIPTADITVPLNLSATSRIRAHKDSPCLHSSPLIKAGDSPIPHVTHVDFGTQNIVNRDSREFSHEIRSLETEDANHFSAGFAYDDINNNSLDISSDCIPAEEVDELAGLDDLLSSSFYDSKFDGDKVGTEDRAVLQSILLDSRESSMVDDSNAEIDAPPSQITPRADIRSLRPVTQSMIGSASRIPVANILGNSRDDSAQNSELTEYAESDIEDENDDLNSSGLLSAATTMTVGLSDCEVDNPVIDIRSQRRKKDYSDSTIKEILLRTAPLQSTTLQITFCNRGKSVLKLRGNAVDVRYDNITHSIHSTLEPQCSVKKITRNDENDCNGTTAFEISPSILSIPCGQEGSLFVTFRAIHKQEGNYCGVLKLRSQTKNFIMLLRGEARLPAKSHIMTPEVDSQHARPRQADMSIPSTPIVEPVLNRTPTTEVSGRHIWLKDWIKRIKSRVSSKSTPSTSSTASADHPLEIPDSVELAPRLQNGDVLIGGTINLRNNSQKEISIAMSTSCESIVILGMKSVTIPPQSTERVHVVFPMESYKKFNAGDHYDRVGRIGFVYVNFSDIPIREISVELANENIHRFDNMTGPSPAKFAVFGYGQLLPQQTTRLAPISQPSISQSKFPSLLEPTVATNDRNVAFKQSHVDFGCVAPGTLCRSKVDLCNYSDVEVHIVFNDPALPFVLLHNEVCLRPKSFVRIPIRFVPTARVTNRPQEFKCALTASAVDGSSLSTVQLTGSTH